MAANWAKIKLEYINGAMPMTELADSHKVTYDSLAKRVSREGWNDLRQEKSNNVQQAAQAKLDVIRPNELVKFNEDGLKLAKALMAQSAAHIKAAQDNRKPMPPIELRQVATTISEAQKIGRLALGVTTENTGISNPDGSPIEHKVQAHNFTPDEYKAILKEALSEI